MNQSIKNHLNSVPNLHSWDDGVTWNHGGFDAFMLNELYDFIASRLGGGFSALETGAGNSTIMFLNLNPSSLISIAPDDSLFHRINSYCNENMVSTLNLKKYVDYSEWVLPIIAATYRNDYPPLDIALLDGGHNFTDVFVDFFYINHLLKKGGYLILDDVQLEPVSVLVSLLSEQPNFKLELDLKKTKIFSRTDSQRLFPDWGGSPYITNKLNSKKI